MIRRRRYALTLRDLDALDDREAAANLRRALKYLLRATRLRCVRVVEEPAADDQQQRQEPSETH